MTPKEAEDKLAQQHVISISTVENPWYPYIAQCSCNWQAVSRSMEEAENYRNVHLNAQRTILYGNGIVQGHL